MNINTYQVSHRGDAGAVDARHLAEQLLAGDRIMIEPVGEVFMHRREDGTPEIEFVYENLFIAAVVDMDIERLTEYTDALKKNA